jgi:catechol 2,3-dioxygenase-like lactoylglutathione lyase family enzyme
MITKLSHTFIYVLDQEEALTFYNEILGFDLVANVPLGPDKKWISVSPPDQPELEIVLMKAMKGLFFTDETAMEINQLISKGTLGWCVFECKDIYATYEELLGKGVEFIDPPTETPAGISANFKDNSGNWFSLTQTQVTK